MPLGGHARLGRRSDRLGAVKTAAIASPSSSVDREEERSMVRKCLTLSCGPDAARDEMLPPQHPCRCAKNTGEAMFLSAASLSCHARVYIRVGAAHVPSGAWRTIVVSILSVLAKQRLRTELGRHHTYC